jgi:glycosyltransferase involved in cell wall biosynthesis
MKKILHITNRLVIGGPSRHVAMLSKGLQSDYEVMVVGGSAAPGEVLALDLFEGLKNQPILIPELSRKLSLSRDYKVYRKLRKIIQEFQPDIVHTHTSKAGALGRKAAKKEGVAKIVHTYHGLIFENYFSGVLNTGLIKFERSLAKSTNHIIALSNQQKNSLVQQYKIAPENKFSIIPLALDSDDYQQSEDLRKQFRNQYNLSAETVAIGIIGRLVPIKNIKLFLDGIHYLKQHSTLNIQAFIVGDGIEKDSLMTYAQSLGLKTAQKNHASKEADVVFTSWVKDLKSIYSGLDIVALSSKSEGTPMSLMEAQMTGKAIIASNVGGVSDIIPEGTGLLFDINNPQEFFDKLKGLVESNELRTQLSIQAKSHAQEQYRPELMLSRIKEVYEAK